MSDPTDTRGTIDLPFVKMEGCGNDYIYVDLDRIDCRAAVEAETARLAVEMSRRHHGVGSDGLVLMRDVDGADIEMRMFNTDGTEGAMCGNALRCVARHVAETRMDLSEVHGASVVVRTASGPRRARIHGAGRTITGVEVDMEDPGFAADSIPLRLDRADPCGVAAFGGGDRPWTVSVDVDGRVTEAQALSMGNPHLVIPLERDPMELDLPRVGSPLETAAMFPDRANVEFVQIRDEPSGSGRFLFQRTWERGSGETLGCGSGACAAVVAAVSLGLFARDDWVRVELRGGSLEICWTESGPVLMKGPARRVFTGTFRFEPSS